MAHVVTNKCLGCKFTDCVLVCPVACFYELEGQRVIHPEECIDCMACVDECPVHAISDEGAVRPELKSDMECNVIEAAFAPTAFFGPDPLRPPAQANHSP